MLKQLGKPDAAVEAELHEIYRANPATSPNADRLVVHKTSWRRTATVLALSLVAVGTSALWVSGAVLGRGPAGAQSLGIDVEVPSKLASGEAVAYVIRFGNRDRVALRDIQLSIRYPKGFTFASATPTPSNEFHDRWDLGELVPGQDGRITLTGTVIGEVGAVLPFELTAQYQPANFNSPFRSSTVFSTQITSSILDLAAEGPAEVLPEQPASYTLTYQNTADRTLLDVEVQVTYPPGFVFSTAQPAPAKASSGQTNSRWQIASLEPKAKGTITITGGFSASAVTAGSRTPTELVAQIGFVDADATFALQQERAVATAVIDPGLSLSLVVNGKSSDAPVNLGETLNYSVVFKNIGTQVLTDVDLALTLDSPAVDFATVADSHLGVRDERTLHWSKDQVAALARLQPLDEGTIDFSVKLKEAKSLTGEQLTQPVTSTVTAKIAGINGRPLGAEVASKPLVSTINTSLDLDAQVRYFDDDNLAVGSGPLPPVVGQRTSYRVYWRLSNSLNEVADVRVNATLSPGVSWEGKQYVSVGDATYDAKTRTVSWTISRIPAGKTSEDVNVWFDIAVTPTAAQANRIILLTTETTLAAKDSKTGAPISKFTRGSTSNLDDDPFGGGRGLVETVGTE